jgi:hypothetical protein
MSDIAHQEWSPSVGDCVRLIDPRKWVAEIERKLSGRDGVVVSVWKPIGLSLQRVTVRFGKRNGRGKEFELSVYATDLMPWPASQEEDR